MAQTLPPRLRALEAWLLRERRKAHRCAIMRVNVYVLICVRFLPKLTENAFPHPTTCHHCAA